MDPFRQEVKNAKNEEIRLLQKRADLKSGYRNRLGFGLLVGGESSLSIFFVIISSCGKKILVGS
jgi:hypothetical protein